MAVIRYECNNIIKEFDGIDCIFEGIVISVHASLFPSVLLFSARKEMKTGQKFQENKLITRHTDANIKIKEG